MLKALDIFLTFFHLAIILFNLFGWIFKKTRKTNFLLLVLTAASWFILGIWYGFGFCPITNWQWQVKQKLGEQKLPPNFVEYFVEKITGTNFSEQLISNAIAISFVLAVIASVYVNFLQHRPRKKTAG